MIYPASTLILASLVFNAASVLGAPVRSSDSIDHVTRKVHVVDVPAQVRSETRDLASENDIRDTSSYETLTSRNPSSEVDHIYGRSPRRYYSNFYQRRSSQPEAREPELESSSDSSLERRFPRRELYERHSDGKSDVEARSEPEQLQRRYPRAVYHNYYEKRSVPPSPEEPVARSDSEPLVRRFPRRELAEKYAKRQVVDPVTGALVDPVTGQPFNLNQAQAGAAAVTPAVNAAAALATPIATDAAALALGAGAVPSVTQTASSFSITTTLAAGEAVIGANSGLPSDVGDAINHILQNNHADEGEHGTVIQEDTLFVHKVIHENNHHTEQPVHHIVATTIHVAPPVWTPPPALHTQVVQIHSPPPAVHTPQVLYPAHSAVIIGTPMVHTMIVDPLAGAIATPAVQNAAAAPTLDAAAAAAAQAGANLAPPAAAQAGANLAPPAVDLNAAANLSPAPVDLNAAAGANLAPAVDLNAAGANLAPAGANLAPAGANLAPAVDLSAAGANLAPAVDLNAAGANAATINLTGARNLAAQPPAAGAATAARRAVDNIKRSIGFSPAAWASHVRREAN